MCSARKTCSFSKGHVLAGFDPPFPQTLAEACLSKDQRQSEMVSDRTKIERSASVASVERRKHPRYSFSTAAEVVEKGSGARIQGRITDLARGGCYIDAMSPFAVGSEVTIKIMVESKSFEAPARVVFAAPGMGMGMGMGLTFTAIEPEQLPVLQKWLTELSGAVGPEPLIAKEEKLSEKAAVSHVPSNEPNYVLNELIIALMRKNVLSDLEGKTLLQKLLQ
ncbi:MAG: hypothetical protein JWO71_4265 [Candidatus Acidoferrum typicum]|nr:hypothetical protein [Candidatus Acidoferrum typicum]